MPDLPIRAAEYCEPIAYVRLVAGRWVYPAHVHTDACPRGPRNA